LTIVVDASVIVAALTDERIDGDWARELLASDDLAAPQLMRAEAANMLRRAELFGQLNEHDASLAHADLLGLPVNLFPYESFAQRVWELRRNLTVYDGWYVALAESLVSPLATLDARLVRAPGSRCEFIGPS
jgi:predicted nucleic acid-binding protein